MLARKNAWVFLVLSSAFLVLSSKAGAQEGGGVPQAGPNMTPAEVQKIFDGYLLIQAQDALGLTDQQFAQFVPRLKTLQDTRRRFQQERMRMIGELQRITRPAVPRGGPTGDEALLKERLSTLQEVESRFAADIRKAYTSLDEILDVRQQARFRVFEEQIERKKLDLLLRARQQNQNRPLPKKRPPLQ